MCSNMMRICNMCAFKTHCPIITEDVNKSDNYSRNSNPDEIDNVDNLTDETDENNLEMQNDFRQPPSDVDTILRKIQRNNPNVIRRMTSYGMPYEMAIKIVRRIIYLSLLYNKDYDMNHDKNHDNY